MKILNKLVGNPLALGITAIALLTTALLIHPARVSAHQLPVPCDFTTGGGFVLTDQGNHANYGLVASCKNGGFDGHFNFVDHDESGLFADLHVSSTQITGYFDPCLNGCGVAPQYRDICGTADTNLYGSVYFRVRTYDGGEPGSGAAGPDRFGLKLEKDGVGEAVVVSTRYITGGNIQLHKPNPSTTGPNPAPDEITACHMDDSGLGS